MALGSARGLGDRREQRETKETMCRYRAQGAKQSRGNPNGVTADKLHQGENLHHKCDMVDRGGTGHHVGKRALPLRDTVFQRAKCRHQTVSARPSAVPW